MRIAAYQQKTARNQKICERKLKIEDLALRRLEATGKRVVVEKLAPTWEGPFRVTKVIKPGVYKIEEETRNLAHGTFST